MDVEHALKPVFTDASGRRPTVLRWLVVGLGACLALVTCAVAFTFVTQVSLPSLDALAGPHPGSRPPATAHAPAAGGKLAFDAARRSLAKPPTDLGSGSGRRPAAQRIGGTLEPRAGERGSAAAASPPSARAPRSAASHPAPRRASGAHDGATKPPTKVTPPPVKAPPSPEPPKSGHGHGAPAKPHKTEKHHKPHKGTGQHHSRHQGRGHSKPHKTEKHHKPHKPHGASGSQHGKPHKPKSTHPGRSK